MGDFVTLIDEKLIIMYESELKRKKLKKKAINRLESRTEVVDQLASKINTILPNLIGI